MATKSKSIVNLQDMLKEMDKKGTKILSDVLAKPFIMEIDLKKGFEIGKFYHYMIGSTSNGTYGKSVITDKILWEMMKKETKAREKKEYKGEILEEF